MDYIWFMHMTSGLTSWGDAPATFFFFNQCLVMLMQGQDLQLLNLFHFGVVVVLRPSLRNVVWIKVAAVGFFFDSSLHLVARQVWELLFSLLLVFFFFPVTRCVHISELPKQFNSLKFHYISWLKHLIWFGAFFSAKNNH